MRRGHRQEPRESRPPAPRHDPERGRHGRSGSRQHDPRGPSGLIEEPVDSGKPPLKGTSSKGTSDKKNAAPGGGVFIDKETYRVKRHMGLRPRRRPMTAEMANSTIATKKISFAISTAVPAIPPKPNRAATSAMMRKVTAQ